MITQRHGNLSFRNGTEKTEVIGATKRRRGKTRDKRLNTCEIEDNSLGQSWSQLVTLSDSDEQYQ